MNEDVFNFSLIDSLQHNAHGNPSYRSKNNIDLCKLNDTIEESLNIYNQEVLRVSEINTTVDILRKKQETISEYMKRFNHSIGELRNYISKHFETDEGDLEDISRSVNSIETAVTECQTNLIYYIDKKRDENKEIYLESQANLNSLHSIFSLVKFNKHVCPICMQHEASHFTLPCGHVYCEKCSNKIKVCCFVCRQNIYKVKPLYFS